jgi:hypothetical protein
MSTTMHLYIEGHNHRRGFAISRSWSATEIRAAIESGETADEHEAERLRPVRYVPNHRRAALLVERFNRRFGS